MQKDLYYNCLLKHVKQVFSCRSLYIRCISVYKLLYKLILCYILSYEYHRGEYRLGGERLGAKRLGEEMVWGAKRPGQSRESIFVVCFDGLVYRFDTGD